METPNLLITGADGGLGTVVTQTLLSQGFRLIASAISQQAVDKLAAAFPEAIGKTLDPVICDLANEADVAGFVQKGGRIHGLVHLAGGYTEGKTIGDYTVAQFDHLFNLNTKPAFLLLKYAMPVMKSNGFGSIITIGAKPALHPVEENAVYTASKSAVIALTLSAAEEGRRSGVRANCIVPAALQTPGNLSWASTERFATFTPLQDVADTIAYLLSDQSKGITGTVIPMYNKISS